jgi:hypothetical protein
MWRLKRIFTTDCTETVPVPFEAWVMRSIVLYPHQVQVLQTSKFFLVSSVEDPVLSTSSLRIRYGINPTGTRRRRRTRQARPQSPLLKLVSFSLGYLHLQETPRDQPTRWPNRSPESLTSALYAATALIKDSMALKSPDNMPTTATAFARS